MDKKAISYAKIFPPIGIARVGNSQAEFFIGPESPGHEANPDGGFKDKYGRIKRQAARFRLYAYDKNHNVIGELTSANAVIKWTVHLVNGKGAWHCFAPEQDGEQPLRNNFIKQDRSQLVVDPGPRSISGRRKQGHEYRFEGGTFLGTSVDLGEIRTDSAGRILVLGGYGHSGRTKQGEPIKQYANNDYWYDDTSDGPVSAEVTVGGKDIKVTPAHVLVTPPNFAPGIANLVTLYDVMNDVPVSATGRSKKAKKKEKKISFTKDIYPILYRLVRYQWVNKESLRGHGPGKAGDFLGEEIFSQLSSAATANKSAREAVLKRIRNPNLKGAKAKTQANRNFMPPMAGDTAGDSATGAPRIGLPSDWLSLLPSQYDKMVKWAKGDFVADWKKSDDPQIGPEFPTLEEIPVKEQPDALTRAALEPCVGGPFCPGIEMTYVARDPALYAEPFRLKADLQPGDILKHMAVPWQADFYECNTFWWPAQRPDDVIPESEYQRIVELDPDKRYADHGFPDSGLPGPTPHDDTPSSELDALRLAYRVPWARGVEDYTELTLDTKGDNAMVELWSKLGFVVQKQTPNVEHTSPETVYIESEREPYVGISPREFYYYLSNIESHQDFLPKAREIGEYYLKLAWESQQDSDFPASWRYFPYSNEAFQARLNLIYNDLVNEWRQYDPATDPVFQTREDVIEWMVQMAPFNQNDGAWIHSITPAGPLDEAQSLLFSIWMDEAGDGKNQWSHCNLYTATMQGLGRFFPDPRSRAYAEDLRFMDSAFTVPMLELALAQFPQTFYPELLGFTLQLEWTVVSLEPMVMLLDYYGIDPHFYRLHIGIDNASQGHGAKARDAIQLYLDKVRNAGGEEAVQEQWKRIWTGFIAFGSSGTLGEELKQRLQNPPSLESQVEQIIQQKQPYGSLNHGEKMLGPNRINDWLSNPPGLMKELVKSGYIIPGNPDESPFFAQLTSFDGPMFKVFNDEELHTLRAWTLSLDKPKPPAKLDYAVEMAKTIVALGQRQVGAGGHRSHKLKGIDPSNPDREVNEPVSWWFEQVAMFGAKAVIEFMRALSSPENGWIVSGKPDKSRFVSVLLAPAHLMGEAFASAQPGAVDPNTGELLTRRDIAINWIKEGCNIPIDLESPKKRYSLLAPPPEGSVYPPHRIHGMGGIH